MVETGLCRRKLAKKGANELFTHENTGYETMGLKRIVKEELRFLKAIEKKYCLEIESLPKGYLNKYSVKGRTYLRVVSGTARKHLSMKKTADIEMARQLRRRRFLEKVVQTVSSDIDVLEDMLRRYSGFDPKEIFDGLNKAYHLPQGREKEVLPGFFPQKAAEMKTRSKSESMAALALELLGLEAQYEREILLEGKAFRPDFTIRHPETNELIYYEHFGMIDDPVYYRNMIEKLMIYWRSGIRLGENLIVTFETKDHPLTAEAVINELERFFGRRAL